MSTSAPSPVAIVTEYPETAPKIADVMATKMTPFVDLGLTESSEDGTAEALKEVEAPELVIEQEVTEVTEELPKSSGKGVVKVQLTENDIRDIMMAIKEETEEEGHTLTKTDLVEMAVERLQEMEDKLGNNQKMGSNVWHLTPLYYRNHGGYGESQNDGPPRDPRDSGGGRHRQVQ